MLFDEAWLEQAVAAFDASLLPEEASGSIALTVLGGPNGDIPTVWHYDGGLRSELADDPDADLALSISWNDALAILRSELVPAVAYMQGRLKGSGNMSLMLGLMREGSSPAFVNWRANLPVPAS